jgi:hypothetical protein
MDAAIAVIGGGAGPRDHRRGDLGRWRDRERRRERDRPHNRLGKAPEITDRLHDIAKPVHSSPPVIDTEDKIYVNFHNKICFT